MGCIEHPLDVANMAAHLLSGIASFVTLANLLVDGGLSKRVIY